MNFSKSQKNFSDARNNLSQDGFDFPGAKNNFSKCKKFFSKRK